MNTKQKSAIWLAAIIGIICLLYYNFYGALFSPGRSFGRGFSLLTYEKKAKFDLCRYTIPNGFEFKKYFGGNKKQKKYGMLFLKNPKTQQIILLLRIPECLSINLKDIKSTDTPLKRTTSYSLQPLSDDFNVYFYMPRIFTTEFLTDGSLILRGIDIIDKDTVENERTISAVWQGRFKDVALDKENESIFRNIPTVFSFNGEKEGAIAVINDKKNGNSLIAITAISEKKEPDLEAFKQFIDSIDFETVVFDPYRVLKEKGMKYEEF